MRTRLLFLLVFLIAASSSCKKGCTKPYADNYDPSAKEDDASCLSCQRIFIDSASVDKTHTEWNSFSPHYQEDVLLFKFHLSLEGYSGNDCKRKNLPTCDTGAINNVAPFTVTCFNIIGDTIVCNADIALSLPGSFQIYRVQKPGLLIPPLTKLTLLDTTFSCIPSNNAIFGSSADVYAVQYRP